MATPFVQGGLRSSEIEVEIETECAHCKERINISLTSDLKFQVKQPQAAPVVFAPVVDFEKLAAPTIIDDF